MATKLGALWQKESNKGTYFTGSIVIDGKETKIVCFQNSYKKEDKHPDFVINLSEPQVYNNTPRTPLNGRRSNQNEPDTDTVHDDWGDRDDGTDIPF